MSWRTLLVSSRPRRQQRPESWSLPGDPDASISPGEHRQWSRMTCETGPPARRAGGPSSSAFGASLLSSPQECAAVVPAGGPPDRAVEARDAERADPRLRRRRDEEALQRLGSLGV